MRRAGLTVLACVAFSGLLPGAAHAAPNPSRSAESKPGEAKAKEPDVGPQRGAGKRRVESRAVEPNAKDDPPDAKPEPAVQAKTEQKSHQRGRPPRKPNASLPQGVAPSAPNKAVRRQVAGTSTADDLETGNDDPELNALREADRVLFPKPLQGATPGWSWDLPAAAVGPRVESSGLPPDARLRPLAQHRLDAKDEAFLKRLTLPNLPLRLDVRVVKYLRFYRDNPRGKAIARVWAKKSGRYVPALKAELARAGLPTDLVWLSLIESGHNPTIISPAGAAGLWQFMPESGRLYGLTVDRWVDERLDPLRCTQAAVKYLSDLHRRFGNWELAMASYNMGYGGLSRAIKKFNTNDFWELSRYEAGIPWETTLYVPKIFAIAIVMNNKKAFGLGDVREDAAVNFDTVLTDPGVPVETLAKAAGISQAEFQALNPQLLAGRTPPNKPFTKKQTWPVRVPAGKGVAATHKLARTYTPDPELSAYVVRFGENAETIAKRLGVPISTIKQENRLGASEVLATGTVLLVPKKAAAADPQPDSDEVVVVPAKSFQYPGRERVFYRVRGGDSLHEIAKAFGIKSSDLVAWNSLDRSARLQSGMVLQVFVAKDAALGEVRHLREDKTRVLVAGSPEFFDYYEGQRGKKRIEVSCKEGDTLRGIGRRYGMSIGWMERVNRRSRSTKLHAGDVVIVYADKSAGGSAPDSVEPKPLGDIVAPAPDALPPASPEPTASSDG